MRTKAWLISITSAVIGVGFLAAASSRLVPLQQAREKMGLVANPSLENAPPSLAFATVAMGAFRGLIVDILWMRADTLKQEGKFFDARQLAEWITALQPRFAAVWDFHAWNMAYNISVAIPNTQPEERWRWVKNGYELLRDRAIVLNPRSILLYRSLAWIFQHKIGDISDDCHRYYKRELALSMRSLLGENPTNETFQRLASAPKTLDEVLTDPAAARLIAELQQADSAFADAKLLIPNYLTLRRTPARFKKEAFDVIDRYRSTEALRTFDTFARSWQLRNEWKFDIDFMMELNRTYGPSSIDDPNERMPLNWEHPAAHAIYWAALGLKVAGRPEEYRIDEKNTDRIVFHSLQMLYRTGKVVLYDVPNQPPSVYLLPDLRMFESCDQLWKKVIEKYESLEKGNPKAVRGGHKNFLENAVLMFYQAGHQRKAEQIYRRLQKEHLIDESGYTRTEYTGSLMNFLRIRLKSELEGISINDATEFILSVLREGYFRYALHDDDEAAGRENMAQEIYSIYQQQMGQAEPGRVGLPPMGFLRYQAFIGFLNDPMYPDYMRQSLINRIQLERPDLFDKLRQEEARLLEQMQKEQP
ncbi:MAG TPA: hypothetical protein PK052_04555 [Anaerohalosphaeraceae bacterium]|nr:hypothetical protein [Phycisphaerae bacterium]HOK95460.1 hypothetical protein [Anaerohalosphaeraceae bacterium]HOL31232.1 hypothetical protein [Anaerohalosphaeraceae bacterium]HOM75039.1 hypothetical protein [Anaerohalosphaeraceae bacterium]HPC63623.1 hypothetical protein [Anaerohalosphaeraceae bacterium]